ncbi:uncharacterized protein [Arachis hypogaea]|uniref:uncharacterized protein n=1 Tax=Arachis hypogaea TaxID=3818 RepID=UPI003B2241AD
MLNCAISFEEYRKVSRCKIEKKIWDKLQVTHEGTTQVKRTRIDMLSKEYKIFSMKEGESIDEIFERFNVIINGLDATGITHPKPVLVRKVLRSLNKEWEIKAMVIAKSSIIDQMTYDDLRGNLLAFETTYLKNDTKKKEIALKSFTESLDDESSDNLSDDEFVLFAKKFRKMMKVKERCKGGSLGRPKRDLNKIICHNCREVGHYKFNYPKLKKEENSKKEKNQRTNLKPASWPIKLMR